MKFFITGATGFIGSRLTHALVNNGHEVVALVRSPHKIKYLPEKGVEIVRGDLSIFEDDSLDLPRFDRFIHLAANFTPASDSYYYEVPVRNTAAILNCLDAQDFKVDRFIFSSSLAAAGPVQNITPLDESSPLKPIEPYGISKRMVEEYLIEHAPCPVTIVRPPSVFGAEDRILNLFKMGKSGTGFMIRNFNQHISFVYIDDLISAMAKLATEEGEQHTTYYVSAAQFTNLQEIWKTMSEVMDKKIRVLTIPKLVLLLAANFFTFTNKFGLFGNILPMRRYKQMVGGHYLCSSEKVQKTFNWSPEYDLKKTLKATYEQAKKEGKL